MSELYYESSFAHHGIRGMRWGVRRYQNRDGSLTPRGEKRYQKELQKISRDQQQERRRLALENARVKEARKTAQMRAKLQNERKALEDERKGKKKNPDSDQDNGFSKSKKKMSDMSVNELSELLTKVQLQQQIRSLTTPPPKQMNPFVREVGKIAISALSSEVSKAIGTTIINTNKHQLDMERMDKEAKKLKADQKREDDVWKRNNQAAVDAAERKYKADLDVITAKRANEVEDRDLKWVHDKLIADEQWNRTRTAQLEDRDFAFWNPDYIPMDKRSKGKGDNKKND